MSYVPLLMFYMPTLSSTLAFYYDPFSDKTRLRSFITIGVPLIDNSCLGGGETRFS